MSLGPLSVREHNYCMRQAMSENNIDPIGFIHEESLLYEMIAPKDGKMCGTWRLCERCKQGYKDLGWKLIYISENDIPVVHMAESRNIYDYTPILQSLKDEFGYLFWDAMLQYCKVLNGSWEEADKYWQVWLVWYKGKVIGVCGLFSHKKDYTEELWLGWFGLLPEFRKQKLGCDVLKFMEKHAASIGCKRILSYVDSIGKPLTFYYKNGYNRISTVEEYLEQNIEANAEDFEKMDDHVIMKDLEI